MADDRPVIKQDLDDLKKHLDTCFRQQSEARAKMYERLEKASNTDVAHGLKIENIEARQNRFFAALTSLCAGFFLAAVKFGFDLIKGA